VIDNNGLPLSFDDDQGLRKEFKRELESGLELNAEIEAVAGIADPIQRELAISRLAELFKGKIRKSTIADLVAERTAEAKSAAQEIVEQVRREKLKVEPVDAAQLIRDLEKFFSERAHLPEGAALLLAFWVLNTWTYELFDTVPYLSLESAVPGCGKTTVVRLLKAVSCRSQGATSITEAVLFRFVDQRRPTLLIDEAETIEGRSERAEALKAICHEGYKQGGQVARCEGDDHQIHFYNVFGPKLFAAIGGLSGALLERCHVIHMEKAPKGSTRKTIRLRQLERDAKPLLEKLEAYTIQGSPALTHLYNTEPDAGYWPAITDREAELWSPLLYHARLAGGDLERRLLAVVDIFAGEKAEIQATEWRVAQTIALLEAISKHEASEFTPSDLLERLVGTEAWSRPFAEIKGTGDDAKAGRAAKVGYALRKFRLKGRKNSAGRTAYSKDEAVRILSAHVPQNPPYPPYPPAPNPPCSQVVESAGSTEATEPTETFAHLEHDGNNGNAKPSGGVATLPCCRTCGSYYLYKTPAGYECQSCLGN